MGYNDFADVMGSAIGDTQLLHLLEEQPVASSSPKPVGLDYFVFPKTGVEVITRGPVRKISTVLLYGPKYSRDYQTFQGELPKQIVFGESLSEIESKLGASDFRALTDKHDIDERVFLRLRYQRVNHLLDLVLNEEQSLFMVRLLAVPQLPRF